MIIFISDFDLRGSGYMNIAVATCNELALRGHEIKALGLGYDGGEHNWNFSIIPVPQRAFLSHIPAMIQNMRALADGGHMSRPEAIVVALDIPFQERLLKIPQREGLPYIGIFPIESGPLCQSWAGVLSQMDVPLVISKFGLGQMEDAGLDGRYFPVGLDTDSWRMPSAKERKRLRERMNYSDDQMVVLTVADNQERKNLSAAFDTISRLKEDIDVQYMLVTRINSQVGWKLSDLAIEKGIIERYAAFERGLPFAKLWSLFAIADAFLLTSKAEGLCMPIVEAMATGTPVVATDCTAVSEHLFEDPVEKTGQRGFPIEVQFEHQDPWGNSFRHYASPRSAADQLKSVWKLIQSGEIAEYTDRAREYAESRVWGKAGDVLDLAIEEALSETQGEPTLPQSMRMQPPTLPHVIPIQEDD